MARTQDTFQYAQSQTNERSPRLAVQIIFDASSPTITSKAGISNLPGTAIEGVLQGVSSVTQQVWPDEGRATIGSCTITIMDNASPTNITEELLDQLENNGEGIRDKEIRLWRGFSDDFDEYERVGTFYADSVQVKDGVYRITCRDKSRALREYVMDPKAIRLGAELSATATTITCDRDVADQGFQMIETHAGWGNYASTTCGWLLLKKTGEIVKYTGISGSTFTGVSRGQFNTKARAIEYDSDDPEEIEEFIYIEGPAIWAALAVMTGVIDPDVSPRTMLPSHWHLGLDYDNDIDLSDWTGIGEDLYDSADMTAGFPVRGTYLDRTQGKAFLEKEIYRLVGVYAPTKPDGKIGLRRVPRLVGRAPVLAYLNESSVVDYGPLRHDQSAISNKYEVNWNYNGEELNRRVSIIDTASVNKHGAAETRKLDFKLLHSAAHTQSAILDRMLVLRDRYAEPPLRLSVKVVPPLDWLELGDAVEVDLSQIPNYQASGTGLDSVFEIQRVQNDWLNEKVTLELFASSRLISSAPDGELGGNPVADSWYTSAGTNIATLTNYSAGHITGNETLTGHATDVNNSAAIFYHDGDLTIDAGAVLTIQNNVQLRIGGFLTVNGKIDGKGNGCAGGNYTASAGDIVTDLIDTDYYSVAGTQGFLGGTQGWVGFFQGGSGTQAAEQRLKMPLQTQQEPGKKPEIKRPTVDDSGLVVGSFPKQLCGSGSSSGAPILERDLGDSLRVEAPAGDGGSGGAGLAIFCRGMAIGPTSAPDGIIDLSGDEGGAAVAGTHTVSINIAGTNYPSNYLAFSGPGGGGAPGMLLVLLDGDTVPYPNLTETNFIANLAPTSLPSSSYDLYLPEFGAQLVDVAGTEFRVSYIWRSNVPTDGSASSPVGAIIGSRLWGQDQPQTPKSMWEAAQWIRYLPQNESVDEVRLAAPQSLTAEDGVALISLTWEFPDSADTVEVFASVVNDRAFAEEIYQGRGDSVVHGIPAGGTRYYWIRARGSNNELSEWYPVSSTAGVEAEATAPVNQGDVLGPGALPNKDGLASDQNGTIYIHGYDSLGNPSESTAPLKVYGVTVQMPYGSVISSQPVPDTANNVGEAWIVFDSAQPSPAVFQHGGTNPHVAIARKTRSGWYYDNGTTWAAFTATSSMVAVGTVEAGGSPHAIISSTMIVGALSLGSLPVEMGESVQLGDIQAGAVTAESLAAQLILSSQEVLTDDPTASPAPFYVRLKGGATIPIYFGNESTPTFDGSKFGVNSSGDVHVSGAIDLSRIIANEDQPLVMETSGDEVGAIGSNLVSNNFGAESGHLLTSISTGYVTITTLPDYIYHPSYSASPDVSFTRLQTIQQYFLIEYGLLVTASDATAIKTISFRVRYRYDGGSWQSLSASAGTTHSRYGSGGANRAQYVQAKASGWTDSIEFDLQAAHDNSDTGAIYVYGDYLRIRLMNLGNVNCPVIYTLT